MKIAKYITWLAEDETYLGVKGYLHMPKQYGWLSKSSNTNTQ